MRAPVDALGYFRSLAVTLPLIYLATILWGALSLLVSLVDSSGRGQRACARLWARSLLLICRVRVRVRGREQLPQERACVFVANHLSYIDIPVVFAHLPANFRILAKASLFGVPFIGWHLRRAGHLPIPSANPRRAARSLLAAVAALRKGTPVFVFPEGGRSLDGRIAEFKPGTFLMAIKAAAPVVPVTITGTREILRVNSWHVRTGRAEMILHAPIETAGRHGQDAEQLAARVRGVIASTLDETTSGST